MGKTTPKYPEFAGGQININGHNQTSTTRVGNDIVTDYNMNSSEKQLYDYSQKALANAVPQINSFLPETWDAFNKQIGAYTARGAKAINEIYDPMLTNLKNDMASRFGNFDNSAFMDNLNKIESKRSDAVSSLGESVAAQQNSLINDELSRRYNYINLLNMFQNQPMQNALNFAGSTRSNSQMGNDYNQKLYQQMLLEAAANSGNIGNYAQMAGQTASAALPLLLKLLPKG